MADIQTLWQIAQAQENNRGMGPLATTLTHALQGMKKGYDERTAKAMELLKLQAAQREMEEQRKASEAMDEAARYTQRMNANKSLGLDLYKANPMDKTTTGKFQLGMTDNNSLLNQLMKAGEDNEMYNTWGDKDVSFEYGPSGRTMKVKSSDPNEKQLADIEESKARTEYYRTGGRGRQAEKSPQDKEMEELNKLHDNLSFQWDNSIDEDQKSRLQQQMEAVSNRMAEIKGMPTVQTQTVLEPTGHLWWKKNKEVQKKVLVPGAKSGQRVQEVERRTKDGRIAVFDAATKQFLRYK